jgi:uncharacterized protein (DUF362 family)
MAHLSRREFLKLGGLAAAGLALLETGCSSDGKSGGSAVTGRTPIPPTGSQAYLAAAHGNDPAAITKAALASLGGMGRFVKQGQDVIIKPNICVDYHPPEYAATTNPTVVATLVALCLAAGAKRVRVMDSPFAGISAPSAYAVSGIEAAVKEAGGEMEVMSPIKFAKFDLPDGKDITSWKIYRDVLDTDVLIDVPVAKQHNLARLTLGCKNLLGVVTDPNQIHINLGQRVPDLVSLIRPTLTVVDAYRILVEHGPTGGSLNDVKPANTVIASHDIIAADAYGATLFDLTGADVPIIKKGAAMGLGTLDLASVKVEEVNV